MRRNHAKRFFLLVSGMLFMGMGIAVITRAGLGAPPIATLSYVIGAIGGISLGTATFALNALLLAMEAVILGRMFKPSQILQLPAAFLFSLFIDAGMLAANRFTSGSWAAQIIMVAAGVLILAFGIVLEIASSTVFLPGDGFVLALAYKTKLPFGNIKVMNDIAFVLAAFCLGMLFLGKPAGLREGTAIAAGFTGFAVKAFGRVMNPVLLRWLNGSAQNHSVQSTMKAG